MWTKKFWRETLERAVRTAAQSAILAIGADQVNALAVNWGEVGGFAAGGFALAALTSLAFGNQSGGGVLSRGRADGGPRHAAE